MPPLAVSTIGAISVPTTNDWSATSPAVSGSGAGFEFSGVGAASAKSTELLSVSAPADRFIDWVVEAALLAAWVSKLAAPEPPKKSTMPGTPTVFQLQPVGSVAHVQVCGTLSCMLMGAEDLMATCEHRIGHAHSVSADGKFSWEEVECLGACANAPMAQIGKDYYEDLTPARFEELLDEMAAGKVPLPGPQNGRYASEPKSGLTTLKAHEKGRAKYNASVQRAVDVGDTLKRIDGTEVPLTTPGQGGAAQAKAVSRGKPTEPKPGRSAPIDETGVTVQEAPVKSDGKPKTDTTQNGINRKVAGPATKTPAESTRAGIVGGQRPTALTEARGGQPDDLKVILGVGPKLEKLLHSLGIFHFDQIAKWKKAELAWIDDNLEGFKGRASRDNWVSQAAELAKTTKRK